MARRAAAMNTVCGGHFNRGPSASFFALGYLGWFVFAPPSRRRSAGRDGDAAAGFEGPRCCQGRLMPDMMFDMDLVTRTLLKSAGRAWAGKDVLSLGSGKAIAGPRAEEWGPLMQQLRRAAIALANSGRLVIYRKGKPADPDAFKGTYRPACRGSTETSGRGEQGAAAAGEAVNGEPHPLARGKIEFLQPLRQHGMWRRQVPIADTIVHRIGYEVQAGSTKRAHRSGHVIAAGDEQPALARCGRDHRLHTLGVLGSGSAIALRG